MIELLLCKQEEQAILANLCQFYHYDLDKSSALANVHYSHGYYEKMAYFDNYWLEDNRFSYFICRKKQLVGFALVHDITVNPRIDWKLAEFFIMAPFRREGIATAALSQLFATHHGSWEVAVLKDNKPAIKFWRTFLSELPVLEHEDYPNYLFLERF